MKERVLVLGSGNDPRQKFRLSIDGEDQPLKGPLFTDNFKEVHTADFDPSLAEKVTFFCDLMYFPWPMASGVYDEVHAYEVFEHLSHAGEFNEFFAVWREVWRVLKPGGYVYATTPWWKSVLAWSDPGHMQVYSPYLIAFLDQAHYLREVGVTSMTDYRNIFPPPYSFAPRWAAQIGEDSDVASFGFILQKEEWNGNSDPSREARGALDISTDPSYEVLVRSATRHRETPGALGDSGTDSGGELPPGGAEWRSQPDGRI